MINISYADTDKGSIKGSNNENSHIDIEQKWTLLGYICLLLKAGELD